MAEVGLSESYTKERDRILAEIDRRKTEIENLPVGVRGLAKVGLAIFRSVGVPIFALFAGMATDAREDLKVLKEDKGEKQRIKRNKDWWKDVLRRFGYKEETLAALDSLIPEDMPGPNIIYTAYLVFFIFNQVGTLSRVISGDTYKELMSRFRPATPTAGEIVKASFIAPELHESVLKILRENGYTEEDIKTLFVANYQLYSISEARSAFYRGVIDEAGLDNRLAEMGYTPERIKELRGIFPTIPGIQDLIMFQAKEQFEPDLIAKFGLQAEAPTEIYEYTRQHGLSDEWTNRYWGAHWQHPSYQQVTDMLHRGHITFDDLWEWFKLVEIPPYWRELLSKISYSPYTRVDVRRMHDLGILNDEQLIQSYKDLGYDDEKAQNMAAFTIRYNAANDRNITRSDIEKGYEDGDLTDTEAIRLLIDIGFSEDYSGYIIWRVDQEKIRATRLTYIELVKEKFTSHLIPETEARKELLQYGVDQRRIGELIAKWNVEKVRNTKLPSKTDLDKMLKANIIDEVRYRQEMEYLGYRSGYVDLYYKLATGGG